MFTRCPACRTVYHITAAELRAAEGTVVCGACDTTFDALESLSEARPEDPPEDEAEPSSGPEEDTPGAIEDARDEDEFLEELESLIGDDGAAEELPPAGFQPLATWPGITTRADRPASAPEDDPEPGPGYDLDDDLEDQIPDPDSVFRVDVISGDDEKIAPPPRAEAEAEAPGRAGLAEEPEVEGEPGGPTDPQAGPAAPPAAREPVPDVEDPDLPPGFVHEEAPRRRWLRIGVPLVAVLVLAGTWAHVQRGKLLRQPAGQAILGPVYSLLGLDVSPAWSPAEFRVLRSEAIAIADEPGDLRVAIEFQNAAEFAQPFPTVRIVLLDRFGQRLRSHDIAPEQYREDYQPDERLPAGSRTRTSVAVPDPGARADGFRVDLCLELEDRGLVCAAEPFR